MSSFVTGDLVKIKHDTRPWLNKTSGRYAALDPNPLVTNIIKAGTRMTIIDESTIYGGERWWLCDISHLDMKHHDEGIQSIEVFELALERVPALIQLAEMADVDN